MTVDNDRGSKMKIWTHSGDSHVLEPQGIWEENMPASFAARMPRVEKRDDQTEVVHVDGKSFVRPLPAVAREGEYEGLTIEEIIYRPPGSYDMQKRLVDLDQEGIWGEVIYPSIALWNGLIQDRELYREGVKVMNDWVAEEVMAASPRYVPTAQLPIIDVDDAIAETVRVAGMGFKTVQLPTFIGGENNWNSRYWMPLWEAVDSAGLVVSFHIGSDAQEPTERFNLVYGGPGGAILNYVETTFTGQRAAVMMIASGALDRYPSLRVLISEGGATWVPFIGDRMDEAYRQHGMFVRPKLSRLPSEIIRDQVYTSFQHDKTAVQAIQHMGYRNVMFGSDYPHVEGTFGHTQETLRDLFDGVEDEIRDRVTQGAFLDLFPDVGVPPAA